MSNRIAFCVLCLMAASLPAQERSPDRPGGDSSKEKPAAEEKIDFDRARQLFQKRQSGGTLTKDEEAYVQRAMEARRRANGGRPNGGGDSRMVGGRELVGFIPLSDMTKDQRYEGEEGGLYGDGQNVPPESHRDNASKELAKVIPRDAEGRPSPNGKIVFVSISMSNATQEFSTFKRIADQDEAKSRLLTIVDCAQGGQAMAEWVPPNARPWAEASRRLSAAGVTPKQVQVAWIKLANKGPRGTLAEHGRRLEKDTLAVLQNARAKYPNLRIAYLSSRIYGGHSNGALNPEPYAYESAFAARWLIRRQIDGDRDLSFADAADTPTPLLLWGPYLWADGVKPRADGLTYTRDDLAGDGTHPSRTGQQKVAEQILKFCKTNPLAAPWFTGRPAR